MGVDVARGLAVIGMIGAHVGVTGMFDWAHVDTWADLVHGRSSILFAVVAGISVALSTGGTRPALEELRAVRLRLVGRGAAVFVIGVLLETLNSGVAVILTAYGVLFIAIIPFIGWGRRRLFLTAAILAVFEPVLNASVSVLSLGEIKGAGAGLVFGVYPLAVWLCFMLAGLALGRCQLNNWRVATGVLVVGILLSASGYGAGALVNADGATVGSVASGSQQTGVPPEEMDFGKGSLCERYDEGVVGCFSPTDAPGAASGKGYLDQLLARDPLTQIAQLAGSSLPHSGGIFEIIGSGGFALAVIGLCLLLARPLRWLLLPLAALGSMPLTVYSAHIVAILLVLGQAGNQSDNSFWFALSLGLLLSATLWAVLFGRGPLERLVAGSAAAMAGERTGMNRRKPEPVAPEPGSDPLAKA